MTSLVARCDRISAIGWLRGLTQRIQKVDGQTSRRAVESAAQIHQGGRLLPTWSSNALSAPRKTAFIPPGSAGEEADQSCQLELVMASVGERYIDRRDHQPLDGLNTHACRKLNARSIP
jgi:hypothetical protein